MSLLSPKKPGQSPPPKLVTKFRVGQEVVSLDGKLRGTVLRIVAGWPEPAYVIKNAGTGNQVYVDEKKLTTIERKGASRC